MRLTLAFIFAIMGNMTLLKMNPEWSFKKYFLFGYLWSVSVFLLELLTR